MYTKCTEMTKFFICQFHMIELFHMCMVERTCTIPLIFTLIPSILSLICYFSIDQHEPLQISCNMRPTVKDIETRQHPL